MEYGGASLADSVPRHGGDGTGGGDALGKTGGSAAPAANLQSTHVAIILALEKEKLRLLEQIGRDKATVTDLESQVTQLEVDILAKRTKLSNYNALFMRLPDADVKAPKQRLGAREAVLGTKRIIQKELAKLENEVIVAEMKLNKSKEKNQAIREKINTLRREQVTYRKLFETMQEELADVKAKLRDTDQAIADGYKVRDRASEEMRELVKQFEFDKRTRIGDFKAVNEAIDAIPVTSSTVLAGTGSSSGGAGAAGGGGGGRSPKQRGTSAVAAGGSPGAGGGGHGHGHGHGHGAASGGEHDALRKRISKLQEKITKDKYATELAQRKCAVFNRALEQIKAATGYTRSGEVIDIFNRYEEEKFIKAQLAQRLLGDIEKLEARVASMHEEVRKREEDNTRLKQARAATIDGLERSVGEREAEAVECNHAVQRAVGEVRSLYRMIEFAFNVLGIRAAMGERSAMASLLSPGADRPTTPAGGAGGLDATGGSLALARVGTPGIMMGGVSPASSPRSGVLSGPGDSKRHRAASFAADARTRHAVRAGVSSSTLAAFVGAIESRGAEIIQQYVAFVSRVSAGLTGGGMAALHFAAAAGGGGGGGDDDDGTGSGGGGESQSAAAFIQTKRKFAQLAGDLTDRAAGGVLSPALLGPANPPGGVRESIATSSIMAALAVDSTRQTVEEMGAGGDDEHRPLSITELKQQAVHKFSSDRNLKALRMAANAAASVLVASPPMAGGAFVGGGALGSSASSLTGKP